LVSYFGSALMQRKDPIAVIEADVVRAGGGTDSSLEEDLSEI
jgi:hypothetical protein